jgi:hypothetical protein|tara:strand:- start:6534 stop:6860 length:327 start_codon:yes stop_codon:yes gene_type:complete
MSGSNRLAGLKARPKDTTVEEVRRVDEVGEARGFLDRTPRKKPGRKPSPRTYQLHPKVFPEVGEAIAAEAERMGITQGQLIEQMWGLYDAQNKSRNLDDLSSPEPPPH